MAKSTKQITVLAEVDEAHVPEWRRFNVRAIALGFANNQLYEAGAEFSLVADANAKPASWYQKLDDGVMVDSLPPTIQNASTFADPVKSKGASDVGFAAGHSPLM